MNRFFKAVSTLLICGVLAVPSVDAQNNGRRPGNVGGRPSSSAPSRGGNHGNNAGRPEGNPGRPGGNPGSGEGRPGGNHGANPGRPGGNPGGNPGVNHNPGRPGGNPGYGVPAPGRPGGSPGYTAPAPGRPGPAPGRPGPGMPPPPHRPVYGHAWSRPVPPPSWRPGPRFPAFSTILGLNFGIGLDASISLLLGNNYSIYSYGNNAVYLNNVNQLNMIWPDATLFYDSRGLDRGEFVYSTGYYDMNRYNLAYNQLVNSYGAPVSTVNITGGIETCWYGYDGRFVTLSFQPLIGADGISRYYTTLTFGM